MSKFKIGDRVRLRSIHSKEYGAGKIESIKLDVATVVFNIDGRIESFNLQMLKES